MNTIELERERLHNETAAACTEDFWQYIRADITAADFVARCAGRGVQTTEEQAREARMRNKPCRGWCQIQERAVFMIQPDAQRLPTIPPNPSESMAESLMSRADRMLLAGDTTQEEYDAWAKRLDAATA